MPLRLCLVGAGYMGRIHLEKLLNLEGVHISGIVDIDKNTCTALSERYNIPFFNDYRDVTDISDAIVISSPTDTHYEIARYCMEKGIHVFIEKPMAKNTIEAASLVNLARDKGVTLQIGHLERFNPAFKVAMDTIKDPVIIEARRTGPYTGRSTDIDVVMDLMIHDIDLMVCIMKARIKRVIKAYGLTLINSSADVGTAIVEFENRCLASIHANRVSTKKERVLTVFERERIISIDLLNGSISINTKKHGIGIETYEHDAGKIDSVKEELKEFIDSISGRGVPTVQGTDGMKALEIAELIRNSLEA
ncbi:MAG: Gfo/Idh/MocA family oxidoreductase [Syntrophorhabdaceae bacterium]|nr:Gfo/Idh/MocA family oxidoreductase [Syntrophorhabdales bacterium]MBP9560270.1 Gfo/Idh/MocA family oxidoreductase [Syntrophorhabdaceae bacterium]